MAEEKHIAYHYDDNGYYTGEMNCQIDPLESEAAGHPIYLTPGDCTLKKPPKAKDGFKIKWDSDKGSWGYEEEKKPEEPEPYVPTEKDLLSQQISQKKWELSQTDYKAIKYAEGLLTEEEYAPIKAERQAMRDEINALQAQLDALEKDEKEAE